MNKELQAKLKKYTAAAAALATASGASAQVIYTDVDPDFVHAGGNTGVGLDVDNDATFDFAFYSIDTTLVAGTHIRTTLVAPYGTAGNSIAGEAPSGYNYALALNSADMIDNTLNWIASTNTMAYNVDSSNPYNENWNGVTDKYLGLQFNTGGNTYFGWARLDVDAIGDVWTLKDYAYNSTAATGIAAGDMGPAGLDNASVEQLVHFINQPNNTVLVKVNGELSNGNVTVIGTNGQTVSNGPVADGSFVVDMNGLASGVYMIHVSFDQGAMTKKMMVTK
ncbi:MAG: hypothetical protein A3D92_00565 [Bacteroidetes bacterium RIFCSPHIGHO2_02_FULL_44_7]|nr:MAG: hypothetical protein A3D92_00565 [Bacteroidetes bacterium RIFCSPHIGHO2_02_FULL_44_7]